MLFPLLVPGLFSLSFMVLAMYKSSFFYAGTDERRIAQQPNHIYQESRCCVIVELYLEVEDAEIESTVVNLNPRVDTVVYHHYLELARDS